MTTRIWTAPVTYLSGEFKVVHSPGFLTTADSASSLSTTLGGEPVDTTDDTEHCRLRNVPERLLSTLQDISGISRACLRDAALLLHAPAGVDHSTDAHQQPPHAPEAQPEALFRADPVDSLVALVLECLNGFRCYSIPADDLPTLPKAFDAQCSTLMARHKAAQRIAAISLWAFENARVVFDGGFVPSIPADLARDESESPYIRFASVQMSLQQVACCLVHQLFGAIITPKWAESSPEHAFTFAKWLTSDTPPSFAYVQCLLDYLQDLSILILEGGCGEEDINRSCFTDLTVIRASLHFPNEKFTEMLTTGPALASQVLPTTNPGARIEDIPTSTTGTTVEVDFANAEVGFGSWGTQEELLFGMTPALCVATLVLRRSRDNECTVLVGGDRYGEYSGYGATVKYVRKIGPPLSSPLPRDPAGKRVILAVDALDLSASEDPQKLEVSDSCARRECLKLFCGFATLSSLFPPPIAIRSGAWGCGAFGGSKLFKSVLQWGVACICGVSIVFCTREERYEEHITDLRSAVPTHASLSDVIAAFRAAHAANPAGSASLRLHEILHFLPRG